VNKKIVLAERNIEELLKNLSADKKSYPNDLLKARRATYLSQVTSVVSGGPHLKGGNGKGQSGSPPSAATPMTPLMKAVLTLLVAANVALASYLAVSIHDNWDKLMGSLSGGSPVVVETSPVNFEIPTQAPDSVIISESSTPPTSAITPESPTPPEETIVPNETPEPANPLIGPQPSEAANTAEPQVGASGSEVGTPDPNDKDNPGKHLGQTPHGPDNPPGQTNQDNSQSNDQGSNQGNNQGNNQNNGQGNNKDNIP
jgi:hypothetical protein